MRQSLDPVNGQVIIRLKRDVRSVTKSELLPMMEKFFAHLSPNDALTLLQRYQLTLEKIRCAVETSNGHFYSSSILFVYDHYNINRWDCRMIDFVHSHIFPPDQLVVDDNYLEGLHSLYEHLKRLQARFKEETCDESTQ